MTLLYNLGEIAPESSLSPTSVTDTRPPLAGVCPVSLTGVGKKKGGQLDPSMTTAASGSGKFTAKNGSSSGEPSVADLACALMRSSIPHIGSSVLVTMAVLECFVRYAKVLMPRSDCIPNVLSIFYDAGLGSTCVKVMTRTCYLFMRLVKPLRHVLGSNNGFLLGQLLQSLEPFLIHILKTPVSCPAGGAGGVSVNTSTSAKGPPPSKSSRGIPGVTAGGGGGGGNHAPTSPTDDRLYLFEALGALVGHDGLAEEQQEQYTRAVLEPLVQQIQVR